ncbi:peptide deformylase [Paracoccus shanxieyensis]|nr:peptide deformylase [Paracoccus shanxieyensis]
MAPQGPDPALLAQTGRIRPVLIHPDPMLRQVCEAVGVLDWASLCQLAGDLLVTMYHAQGRGLAAPQIGQPFRIFVMDSGWKNGAPQPRIFLDPQITPISGPVETLDEQCLSIPGQPVAVTRPTDISVSHYDLMGNLTTTFLTGMDARIAQHEADHLDGVLIIDRLAASGAEVAR